MRWRRGSVRISSTGRSRRGALRSIATASSGHMSNDIRAVVFDLADVLFDFAGPESLARLSNGRISRAEFDRLWTSPLADAFYRGACTPDDFAVGTVAQLGLAITPDDFLEDFAAWFRGPLPGALELVERVRADVVVACLSNTNPLDVA